MSRHHNRVTPEEFERRAYAVQFYGSYSAAAKALGLHPVSFSQWCRQNGVLTPQGNRISLGPKQRAKLAEGARLILEALEPSPLVITEPDDDESFVLSS